MTAATDAIGIHFAADGVHGVYLKRSDAGSDVAGHVRSKKAAVPTAPRIIKVVDALKGSAAIPLAIAWGEASLPLELRTKTVAELERAGYAVTVEDQSLAQARSLPTNASAGSAPELVQCRIPTSLLQAQPDLTNRDLAGAAGAALGILGLGNGNTGNSNTGTAKNHSTPGAAAPGAAVSSTSLPRLDASEAPPAPLAPPVTPPAPAPIEPPAAPVAPLLADDDVVVPTAAVGAPNTAYRSWMVFPLLALLVIVGIMLGRLGNEEPVAEPVVAPTAIPTAVPTATPEPTPTPGPTATPEPEPTATPDPTPVPDYPPLSELPQQAAIYRPPTLFLQGPVPDQETIDAVYGRAVEVLGEADVVNEFVVHPDAPSLKDGFGVQVDASLLFESGSAEVGPNFIPVLDIIAVLFRLNPQMTATIEGHTDSVGGLLPNQVLSEERANAVRDYLVSAEVNPESIVAEGFASTDPVADNDTEEGRQRNRRIEFELSGLLDPRPK